MPSLDFFCFVMGFPDLMGCSYKSIIAYIIMKSKMKTSQLLAISILLTTHQHFQVVGTYFIQFQFHYLLQDNQPQLWTKNGEKLL